MSEIAVHLVDNVLPHAPYRQWVTTFPHALRYWMAASRKLTSLVHGRVNAMIQLYYTNKAEERGIKDPVAGGVTFVQRFGSALNAYVHFHTVATFGVFSVKGPEPVFYQLPGPTDEEVADLIIAVAQVIVKDLKARGFLAEEGEVVTLDPACLDEAFGSSEQLAAALAASASMRIAFGERAGRKVRRIGKGFGYEDEPALAKGRRCFSVNGFSLHANRFFGTRERGALGKLLAYGARGAFSHRRLSLADPSDPSGDLVYTLKTPWSDGTEAIKLSARELIEKLVALIPPPYIQRTPSLPTAFIEAEGRAVDGYLERVRSHREALARIDAILALIDELDPDVSLGISEDRRGVGRRSDRDRCDEVKARGPWPQSLAQRSSTTRPPSLPISTP
jgi:hypothetical protein